MVLVTRTVEHDLGDACFLRARGDSLADLGRLHRLLPLGDVAARDRRYGTARHIVYELRVDVLHRTEDHETRPLGRSRHLLPDAEVAAVPLLRLRFWRTHDRHYLP